MTNGVMLKGKITQLRIESQDRRFIGKVKEDRTGQEFNFDYMSKNKALKLEDGEEIYFLKKSPTIAYGIRKVGYNYG